MEFGRIDSRVVRNVGVWVYRRSGTGLLRFRSRNRRSFLDRVFLFERNTPLAANVRSRW